MPSSDDWDVPLGELPEVRPYGAPGLLVTSEDGSGEIDYDFYLDAAYEYEAQVIEKGIREQVEGRARDYLSANGDAIWERVERALDDGERLLKVHPGASLVSTMTGVELMVRFLLLRPLLAGLVIDPWLAEHLASEATKGLTGRDRDILPRICQAWDIDLAQLKVGRTRLLWPSLGELWTIRNGFVHQARTVTRPEARVALACTKALVEQVLVPLADRLNLGWPEGPFLHGFDDRKDPLAPRKPRISAE